MSTNQLPKLESGALSLAHAAAIETTGTAAEKTEAAIVAYLWALENVFALPGTDLMCYPSLHDLREALGRS